MEKREFLSYKRESKLVWLLWKTVWKVLKKNLKWATVWSCNFILGIYPKKIKALTQKDIYTPMFIVELSTIAKIWKHPKRPPTSEWMRKMWSACVCIRVAELLPFANSWMELRRHYVKGNKWDRVRQILYAITYMWNLKIKEVHGYRAQIGPYGSSIFSFRCISEKKIERIHVPQFSLQHCLQ